MPLSELEIKRALLLSARIRFSPSGASVRDDSIDRIIEQTLANLNKSSASAEEIAGATRIPSGTQILNLSEVRSGIERSISRGRIIGIVVKNKLEYGLSTETANAVAASLKEAEARLNKVASTLFISAEGDPKIYERAFLDLLCRVFSRMSATYVAIMAGENLNNGHVHTLLPTSINETLLAHPVHDKDAFKYAVNRFFTERSPMFDSLKWNMAQNHYVVKALGVDPSARLLSSDLLKNSDLYLDTNVLIAGLIPEDRHHGGILEVVKACRALHVNVSVAQITVWELQRTVAAHAKILRKVYDRIPDETLPKIHCFLLEAYLASKHDEPDLHLEKFIDRFQDPVDTLRKVFEVTVDDDKWFVHEEDSQPTKQLAQEISRKFELMRRRPKPQAAAIHDALMLRWIEEKQKLTGQNCRIVTLDMTLVAKDKDLDHRSTHVITLDALLQWTTPHCGTEAAADHLAGIYAAALRFQLLPSDLFFEPRDFMVFAEMEVETRQLPAEDVEACVKDIHKLGPSLDPGKAEDREKLAREMQRHFADPGTKYKKELAALEASNRTLAERLKVEVSSHEKSQTDVTALKQEAVRLQEKNNQLDAEIAQERTARVSAETQISHVETEVTDLRNQMRRDSIKTSVAFRSLLLGVPLLLSWYFIGKVALTAGEGTTGFQKLTNAWSWFSLPLGIVIVLFPFVMGRERMKFLRWWKGEEN